LPSSRRNNISIYYFRRKK